MLICQDADREKIDAPDQEGNCASFAAFAIRHACKYASHRHKKATYKEKSVYHQQVFQPLIRITVRFNGEPNEKGGKCHHPVSEQVVVEKQAATLIIQQPDCLLCQSLLPDACRLCKVDQKDQDCINCRKDQSYIGRHAPFFAAFVLKTGRHHNIADRQKHADKIGAKRIINDHTE